MDNKYKDKDERTEFNITNLPPIDKKLSFQEFNLC
jgi:hypothetical protein